MRRRIDAEGLELIGGMAATMAIIAVLWLLIYLVR